MDKRRQQLQQELNTINEEIAKLRTDLVKRHLSEDDFKDWEHDKISATKDEELEKLEARREEIEEKIDELTNQE